MKHKKKFGLGGLGLNVEKLTGLSHGDLYEKEEEYGYGGSTKWKEKVKKKEPEIKND